MSCKFQFRCALKLLSTMMVCLVVFFIEPVLAGPRVAVSIAPVHSLMSAVMEGTGVPELLIPPGQSPHAYSPAPSSIKHIHAADLIVWIGPEFEVALKNTMDQVSNKSMVRSIADIQNLISYPVREGGLWDSHDVHIHVDGQPEGIQASVLDDTGNKHNPRVDSHFWLSTSNAVIMAGWFSSWLISIDPENTSTYQTNTDRVISRIRNLHNELQQRLSPVNDIPYILFHDAYQYFEKEFGMRAVGSVTIGPDKPPGAKTIRILRNTLESDDIKCVFSEPQFEPRLISTLIENTVVRVGQLDPIGAEIMPGPELWFEVMANLGESLGNCLTIDETSDEL
jgi:zinc transport system substrate-binding protein